jgi:2-hydroxy-3-keto-5-methylthiopentenyl-1-phosphate phosphatase
LPGKETRLDEEPFRTGYLQLESVLTSAKLIVIVGYSGRDPFIQVALRDALKRDREKHVICVTGNKELKAEGLASLKGLASSFDHFGGGIQSNVNQVLAAANGQQVQNASDSMAAHQGTTK